MPVRWNSPSESICSTLCSKLTHVVIFVEGDTDEVLFQALIEHNQTISKTEISPSKICNLKGVTRYYSKLIAKLQNEYLPVRNVDACQARAVREMRNLN